ncbi:polyketide synthase, partial [Cryptosporidium bovis]|uniref:polyketide synthase n=1 Tax=Cryptosporidium bovis TaxID=310047 RepID=UPI003519FC0D
MLDTNNFNDRIINQVEHFYKKHPEKNAFVWLNDQGNEESVITYKCLWDSVRFISNFLTNELCLKKGDRIILCYSPGLDFIYSFYACLASGIVAIPVYPADPNNKSQVERLRKIVDMSQATTCLTHSSYNRIISLFKFKYFNEPLWNAISWYSTDKILKDNIDKKIIDIEENDLERKSSNYNYDNLNDNCIKYKKPYCEPSECAFIQFTSGSTGNPKGVIVTHGSLFYNSVLCMKSYHFSEYKKIETEFELNDKFDYNEINYILKNIINTRDKFVSRFGHNLRGMSWLPMYHDMGLVGFIVSTVIIGSESILLSPFSFIKKPSLWLKAISKYKVAATAAPNFAFDYVCRKITDDELNEIKKYGGLNCLKHGGILSGSEPIRAGTLSRFSKKFAEVGFCSSSFLPAYGMAENTLIISGLKKMNMLFPRILSLKSDSLKPGMKISITDESFLHCECDDCRFLRKPDINDYNKEVEKKYIVSCGHKITTEDDIIVVCPNKKTILPENHVGEIWVSSKSKGAGYSLSKELTKEIFFAVPNNPKNEKTTYLKTGDLGFINNDQIFVVGRQKDLIIIRGKNYYPQDIEEVLDNSHPLIRPGCSVAFSIEIEKEEKLAIATEIRSESIELPRNKSIRHIFENLIFKKEKTHPEEIITAISKNVVNNIGIEPSRIILIKERRIPKTSSGKVQRSKTKQMIIDGELNSFILVDKIYDIELKNKIVELNTNDDSDYHSVFSENEIPNFILEKIKSVFDSIIGENNFPELDDPLLSSGIESMKAVEISEALSKEFNMELPASLIFDYPTLRLLIEHIDLLKNGNVVDSYNIYSKTNTKGKDCELVISSLNAHLPGFIKINPFKELWGDLVSGKNKFSSVPHERWNTFCFHEHKSVSSILKTRNYYTDIGGFLIGSEYLDTSSVKISQKEVEFMDPQQRLLLRNCKKIISNTVIPDNNVGVYVGCCSNDWSQLISNSDKSSVFSGTGASPSILANRISFYNNFTGPSITVDTACSSSLVALDIAINHMGQNNISTAIVSGVNLILNPNVYVTLCKSKMLSTSGKCAPFDENADGFVRGEGCIMICIQHSSIANKKIAKILATSVNQDGKTSTLTAPKKSSQISVIKNCLDNSNLLPSEINYFESHGTGTPLGDPIEAGGILTLFNSEKNSLVSKGKILHKLVVGAIKSNIGHLEGVAGLAGLLKVLLVMSKRYFPGIANLQDLNTHIKKLPINIDGNNVIFPTSANGSHFSEIGITNDVKLRSGVSSFGFGGTNSHAILEEGEDINYIWEIENEEYSYIQEGNYFPWTPRFHPFISTKEKEDEEFVYCISGAKSFKYIKGHVISGSILFPASGILEIIVSICKMASIDIAIGDNPIYFTEKNSENRIEKFRSFKNLENLDFESRIGIIKSSPVIIKELEIRSPIIIDELNDNSIKGGININSGNLSIYSEKNNHCKCNTSIMIDLEGDYKIMLDNSYSLENLKETCLGRTIYKNELYNLFDKSGYNYSGLYQSLEYVCVGNDIAYGKINTSNMEENYPFYISPWILDSAFQVLGGFLLLNNVKEIFIPLSIGETKVSCEKSYIGIYSIVKIITKDENKVCCDVYLVNENGGVLIEILNMNLIKIEAAILKPESNNFVENKVNNENEGLTVFPEKNTISEKLDWRPIVTSELDEIKKCKVEKYTLFTGEENFPFFNLELKDTVNSVLISNNETISNNKNIIFCECKIDEIEKILTKINDNTSIYVVTKNAIPIGMRKIENIPKENIFWAYISQLSSKKNTKINVIDVESYEDINELILFGIHSIEKIISNNLPIYTEFNHIVIRRFKLLGEKTTYIGFSLLKIEIDSFGVEEFAYKLEKRGELKNFKINYNKKPEFSSVLEKDQVKIQVKAVGLNFRDILNIMNLYPGDPGEPGSDFSGIIIEKGENVNDFYIGDKVWGFAEGSFKTKIVTSSRLITHKPEYLTFEEAAALPVIFCTVEASFNDIYKVKRNDFVLIHAATGGVGIAAVQYCLNIGAIIFATCSSKSKREWLTGIGVHYIMSSRDSNIFIEKFNQYLMIASRKYKKKPELDVVLNCLSGEFIHESFKKLKRGGTFIELGKRNILSDFEANEIYPEKIYRRLEIDELVKNEPNYIRDLLLRYHLKERYQNNPILPVKTFKMESSTLEALKYLQKASHIGKIVVELPPPQTLMFETYKNNFIEFEKITRFANELLEKYKTSETIDKLNCISINNEPSDPIITKFINEIIQTGN